VAPIGREGLQELIKLIVEGGDARVPEEARSCLELLSSQLDPLVWGCGGRGARN
jgi:hypothetical protein